MKIKILYIGNKLNKHGLNKTTIETLSQNLKEEGYDVVSVSNKRNFVFRLFEMAKATFLAKNISYILIDTYSTKAFWYALICSQIARIRKIKYIPILHGGNLPNRLKNNPFLSKLIFKNAYVNVAPSGYLQHEFEKAGFTNVVLIPNTIEIDNYLFKKRGQIQPKLLWVRAFASIYNPEMAIKVVSELQKEFPKATLTMVGPDKDGSLEKCQQLAKTLNVEVIFTGKLSKEEWWKLSEDYDIFINTTHFDNTPISVMEAMALGLPIISTNVGGIPFLVENNQEAFLVDNNDEKAMLEAVKNLLQNTITVQNITANARSKAESYDWEKVKNHWNDLLLN